jgi:hypothetical protein
MIVPYIIGHDCPQFMQASRRRRPNQAQISLGVLRSGACERRQDGDRRIGITEAKIEVALLAMPSQQQFDVVVLESRRDEHTLREQPLQRAETIQRLYLIGATRVEAEKHHEARRAGNRSKSDGKVFDDMPVSFVRRNAPQLGKPALD